MFLHDQIPGQQLWIEDKMYQGKAGFWVAWQGDCVHMAANLSDEERYVLQFTGIAE
jgi:ribosomal protein L21E